MTTIDARGGALDGILTARENLTSPAVKAARKTLRDAKPGEARPCQKPGMERYWDAVDTDSYEHLWPELAYDRIAYAADRCLDCPVFTQCLALLDAVSEDTARSRKRKPVITGVLAGRLVDDTEVGKRIAFSLALNGTESRLVREDLRSSRTGVPFGETEEEAS